MSVFLTLLILLLSVAPSESVLFQNPEAAASFYDFEEDCIDEEMTETRTVRLGERQSMPKHATASTDRENLRPARRIRIIANLQSGSIQYLHLLCRLRI